MVEWGGLELKRKRKARSSTRDGEERRVPKVEQAGEAHHHVEADGEQDPRAGMRGLAR